MVRVGCFPPADYADALRARRALERLRAGIARASDGFLDFGVLAFGAWTVIYHVCLVAGFGTAAAAVAWAAALVPSAWLAFRHRDKDGLIPEPPKARAWPRNRLVALLGGYVLVAGAGAAVYAFAETRWAVTWFLLLVAAVAGTMLAYFRSRGRIRLAFDNTGQGRGPGAFTAVAWAASLAVFSLFLVRPDGDDTQYVHLSTWIAGTR